MKIKNNKYFLISILTILNTVPFIALLLFLTSGPSIKLIYLFIFFWLVWFVVGGLLAGFHYEKWKWWQFLFSILIPPVIFTGYVYGVKSFLLGGKNIIYDSIFFNTILYLPSILIGNKLSKSINPNRKLLLKQILALFIVFLTIFTFISLGFKSMQHKKALNLTDAKAIEIAKKTTEAKLFINKFPKYQAYVDRTGRFAVDFSAYSAHSNDKNKFIILKVFIDGNEVSDMHISDRTEKKYKGLIWNRKEIIEIIENK